VAAKGFALCVAIEVLSGALVGANMGPGVESQYDTGFLAIAIDPHSFGTETTIGPEIQELASTIRASRPREGVTAVRVPGDQSRINREQAELAGVMDITDGTWTRLLKMKTGRPSGMEIK
jgi:ureidoglycolate dehydrogenase (NAD+)/L-2-hydroxycarboxylate dehydrogenase (NAD+)